MGNIKLSQTPEQQTILDAVAKNESLRSQFYYTGGTALSCVYLHHRLSDDLDFFSEKKIDNNKIFSTVTSWGEEYNFTSSYRFIEVVSIFRLAFSNGNTLKVDFSYYPYKKLDPEQIIDGIRVDSLTDIAVNKLLTISQRTEVKDFVDLYFLLQKFSLWDLIHGVELKFYVEIDPLVLASDFLKVNDFEVLPTILLPLTISDLQIFFREQAKKLASTSVE